MQAMQAMQWQNGIIITSGLLLWRLCMPGERHSQTRSVDTEQPTLASEWSRGNIRQLSRLIWPVSDDNITPCNDKWTGGTKSQQYNFHLLSSRTSRVEVQNAG